MSKPHIRFSTDILRRLGEELNPGSDQSIIELVKNAFDADATQCTVELIGTDRPGGIVRVSDTGDGMTIKEITDGWLVLGRSQKSSTKRTRLGRIPAGNKGLGRLAALRMGSSVALTTRPHSEPAREYALRIDWKKFDQAEIVEDVVLAIEQRPRSRDADKGTAIEIRGVREKIGRVDVKRLARAMILLADPFDEDPSGFRPALVAPEYEDLEQLVRRRYFEEADYHLIARVNSNGQSTARVVDWRGETLFSAKHDDIARSRNGAPYHCPPAKFDLWIFLLTKSAFSTRPVSVGEVREWLQEFGGVHLSWVIRQAGSAGQRERKSP